MYDPSYKGGPFSGIFSLAEAAQIWGIDDSTIRKAISDGRLKPGTDCRKFGKQWVVTFRAMDLHFGKLCKDAYDKYQ